MAQNGFYLGGGTAIALMLGHRKSNDLDWFSESSLGDPNSWNEKIEGEKVSLKRITVDKGTLHARANGVRVSLLEYRYPRLHTLVKWKDMGFTMASLDDLACMKLSAIVSRGMKKDFVDIYALMSKHKSLQQMLRLYQKRFSVTDIFPVLRGLSYFDDAERERMPRMIWNVRWHAMRTAILTAVKDSLP